MNKKQEIFIEVMSTSAMRAAIKLDMTPGKILDCMEILFMAALRASDDLQRVNKLTALQQHKNEQN